MNQSSSMRMRRQPRRDFSALRGIAKPSSAFALIYLYSRQKENDASSATMHLPSWIDPVRRPLIVLIALAIAFAAAPAMSQHREKRPATTERTPVGLPVL